MPWEHLTALGITTEECTQHILVLKMLGNLKKSVCALMFSFYHKKKKYSTQNSRTIMKQSFWSEQTVAVFKVQNHMRLWEGKCKLDYI